LRSIQVEADPGGLAVYTSGSRSRWPCGLYKWKQIQVALRS